MDLSLENVEKSLQYHNSEERDDNFNFKIKMNNSSLLLYLYTGDEQRFL